MLAIFFIVLIIAITITVLWMISQTLRDHASLRRSLDIQMLQVLLPKDLDPEEREGDVGDPIKERMSVAEQFLSTMAQLPTGQIDRLLYGKPVIIFEIVAREDGVIVFYAGTDRRFINHLEKQIYAHYPDATVSVADDYTIFKKGDAIRCALLQLRREHYLPIATYKELETDPMQAITGALAKLKKGDAAVIQYVLLASAESTRRKARKEARKTVRGEQSDVGAKKPIMKTAVDQLAKKKEVKEREEDKSRYLTQRTQQRVELVEQKMSQQHFDVTIRICVSAKGSDTTEQIYNAITSAFSQYEQPDLNAFRVHYPSRQKRFLEDLIFRLPRQKTANTLSTTEITSLFHFPLPTTGTPNILWRGAKTAPAPPDVPQKGIVLGINQYRGHETPILFAPDDRRRHMYLIGQTGTGKTTMFLNMIEQDIQEGRGVGVVDPHGDLIEDILLRIPPERARDVILFDPKDHDRPLGFNILESKDQSQKDLIVNEVVMILQKLAARLNPESIGPMFEHYLRNALLALSEDPRSTLIDVPRMFVDQKFRTAVLARNTNPTVKQFWEQEFAQSQKGQLSADMLSYVISKLGRFISNETMRNLIGQSKSSFDVRKIMDEEKILLCNLSKGMLGDINSDLLGFVLVSKLQIAALGRANMPESERKDFHLYLDEFQNFTTDSISTILSEARKYRLCLNLTHQFIDQLDDSIREAVFGNIGTIACYRVGPEDAKFLEPQFQPVFSDYDLINLDRYTTVVRLLVDQTPKRPFSMNILPPSIHTDEQTRDTIRELSRTTYGRPKGIVEQEITERFQYGTTLPPSNDDQRDSGNSDYLSESLFQGK